MILCLHSSADLRACGTGGRDCFQTLGVLRVSLGCFVSFCQLYNMYITCLMMKSLISANSDC
jgi:hypothetical protein